MIGTINCKIVFKKTFYLQEKTDTMARQKWWFAPEKLTNSTPLITDGTQVHSTKIEHASKFSVTLENSYIGMSRDITKRKVLGKLLRKKIDKTNDLFISTRYQEGIKTVVNRAHVFDLKYKEKKFFKPTFKREVCSFDDFTSDRLIINPLVYDVDGYKKGFDQAMDIFNEAGNFTTTYPVAAEIFGAVKSVGKVLFNILDTLDPHDRIIDEGIHLYVTDPGNGDNVLQACNLICFSEDIPTDSKLKINTKRKVLYDDGKEFKETDYVVYTIRPKSFGEKEWETEQRVATLLSQITGNKDNRDSLSYLKDTLEAYSKIKKLKRLNELKEKSETETSKEEKNRLKELQKDNSIKVENI